MSQSDDKKKVESSAELDRTLTSGEHSIENAPPLEPGAVVGKYRLLDSIGEGGMGIVYRVEEMERNKQLALKTLIGTQFSETSIKRFRAEARVLSRLDHPGLVRIHDYGMLDQSKPFLVMDFVQGRTLSSVLKTSGILPLEVTLKIFIELCFALGYAHSQNIVHRDIKPSNIMLTTPGIDSENEHVKVLDFGIAKLIHTGLNETESLTRTGEIFGSPFYMSPEQCTGSPVDHRSDVYSIGCVMYEVLTGAPPFSGETSLATIMMHQTAKPLPLKEASMGREYPEKIQKVVSKLLEKDPDDRYQSLFDVAQILIEIQKGISGGHAAPSKKGEPKRFGFIKSTAGKVTAGACALFAVGGLVFAIPTIQKWIQPERDHLAETSREYWSDISPDGQTKTFHFPDYSIGTLSIGPRSLKNRDREAKGTFTVQKGVRIDFAPNPICFEHPQNLRKFRPDELFELDLHGVRVAHEFGTLTKGSYFKLSDDELVYINHLTGLRSLLLRDIRITDVGLSYISNLPNLTRIDLERTNITADALKRTKWFKQLVALKAGNIGDARALVDALAGSKVMRDLSLSYADLKDEDLIKLATIPNLTSLNISYNHDVTDRGIAYLARLKHLKRLAAVECTVTPASIETFKKMKLDKQPSLALRHWPMEARTRLDALYLNQSGSD